MDKKPKHKQQSEIAQVLQKKKSVTDETLKSNFKVSFQYMDTTQQFASTFEDWEKVGLLSKMLNTLQGYCKSPLIQQKDGDKFTVYGDFPKERSKFTHPGHVPQDAKWARIHINGLAVIAGHIVNDTFYLVFLDGEHMFYFTKKNLPGN